MTEPIPPNPQAVKILIADDHAMFRDTLQLYASRAFPEGEFYMAADLHEVVDVLNRNCFEPDLCLIDFSMPGMKGTDSLAALKKSYPSLRFAVMSGIIGQKNIEEILKMDIAGFLPKTLSGRQFMQGISVMLSGEKFIPYEPDKTITPSHFSDADPYHDAKLTVRESEVLTLLCQGKSNSDIAEKLDLKTVTVKLHMRGIFQKLDCSNRTQAVIKAREWGLAE